MRVLPSSAPRSPARRLPLAVLATFLLTPPAARAQDSARAPHPVLPPVRVTATREGPRPAVELPYALTVTRPDSLAAARRLGVDELLFAVPGVALANRQNPAQDPRISIRGFGARSAFGVRGVRVLQDGIPATLPDGQTPVDALDLPPDERAAVEARAQAGGYPLAALIKDDDRCIRCGLCAIRCPTEAMTMERFTITERWNGSTAS